MKKDTGNLVRQCMEAYEVASVKKLSDVTEIPYTTLNVWENEGPSKIGTLLLKELTENIDIKKNVKLLIQAEETKMMAIKELKKAF